MNAWMKRLSNNQHLLALAAALIATGGLVVACGGGGGGGGGTAPTSTRSMGEITAKGSIFVNGVEFSTQGAELEIENEGTVVLGADDSALKEGMVVMVEGSSTAADTGTATTIFVGDSVEGPISGVALGTSALIKTMVVLGQTVVVEDGSTQFDNSNTSITGFAALDSTDAGTFVEVSGFMRADGNIQATFIQEKAAGGILEVKGIVSNFTAGGTTFSINNLNVSFSGTVNGVLANGVQVEVKDGTGTGFNATTNTLTATSVEVEDGLGDDIAKLHVEGFVAGLTTNSFTVNSQAVSFSATTTEFRGGVEADLVNGVRVEAEGPLTGGVLTATKITFKENVRFEANANVIAAGTLTLQGVSGITIVADSLVTDPNDLAQIIGGNEVKVRARTTGVPGILVATRLEKVNEQSATRMIIQGPVDAGSINATAGTFTILGIGVDTSTILSNDFEIEDTIVTKAQFFAALQAGDIVKARADIGAGGVLTWDQVEIEIED